MLRFQLPVTYPHACAKLSVVCNAPRAVHDQVMQTVTSCAAREQGECCLLTAMQELSDSVSQAAEAAQAERDASSAAECSSIQDAAPCSITRRCIWFHHIKAPGKRKTIIDAARDMNLGGGCKPGFPGELVFHPVLHIMSLPVVAFAWDARLARNDVRCTQQCLFRGHVQGMMCTLSALNPRQSSYISPLNHYNSHLVLTLITACCVLRLCSTRRCHHSRGSE